MKKDTSPKTPTDAHRKTASEVLKVDQNVVTPEQRRAARALNFGILYGSKKKEG